MDSAPESIEPHDRKYTEETRSSAELAAIYLAEQYNTDAGQHALATLHFRGGREEFEIAKRYIESGEPKKQSSGADILSQLGWSKQTFMNESLDLLVSLLRSPNVDVIESALYAFGHRNDPRAIPHALPFASHSDNGVRHAAVLGLSCHDDFSALEALIVLSRDEDEDVRNWATFGLGSMTKIDTPELRDALLARLTDTNAEIRGEALIGLAERTDLRVMPALRDELNGPFYGSWCLEAAELLADPELLPLLRALFERAGTDDEGFFKSDFDRAIAACEAGKPKSDQPDLM